ncbi:hypothetical protein, partial [Streptomyces sp. SID337]|uniref:hypothetical protein n=2 Tax=unclassified Streptomyces TaxID=2593676 RepID=UPI00136B942F|nr:hypothetical protein [Streptomyces sp. SID337]
AGCFDPLIGMSAPGAEPAPVGTAEASRTPASLLIPMTVAPTVPMPIPESTRAAAQRTPKTNVPHRLP